MLELAWAMGRWSKHIVVSDRSLCTQKGFPCATGEGGLKGPICTSDGVVGAFGLDLQIDGVC
jgi:hypothetical protein